MVNLFQNWYYSPNYAINSFGISRNLQLYTWSDSVHISWQHSVTHNSTQNFNLQRFTDSATKEKCFLHWQWSLRKYYRILYKGGSKSKQGSDPRMKAIDPNIFQSKGNCNPPPIRSTIHQVYKSIAYKTPYWTPYIYSNRS